MAGGPAAEGQEMGMRHNGTKARLEDIRRLSERTGSLMGLFDGRLRNAAEAEAMVTQTFRAAMANHAEHGEAFSFRTEAKGLRGRCPVTFNNGAARRRLLEHGYLMEEKRSGGIVLVITQSLADLLDAHFARKDAR